MKLSITFNVYFSLPRDSLSITYIPRASCLSVSCYCSYSFHSIMNVSAPRLDWGTLWGYGAPGGGVLKSSLICTALVADLPFACNQYTSSMSRLCTRLCRCSLFPLMCPHGTRAWTAPAAWLGAEICPIIGLLRCSHIQTTFFPRSFNVVYSHSAWLNNDEAPKVQAKAAVVMATGTFSYLIIPLRFLQLLLKMHLIFTKHWLLWL